MVLILRTHVCELRGVSRQVACSEKEIVFASVHDSFWTHAADVPKMNATIREKFIDLHENRDEVTGEPKYILTELDEALRSRYSEEQVADLPEIPPYGDLDLSRVRESDYFFS